MEILHRSLLQFREHEHPDGEVSEACLAALKEAAGCYRGDFLEGLSLGDSQRFDEWQFFQRDDLRREFAEVLQRLCTLHADRAEWEQAIGCARRWVALDRMHEPACRALMDLYARSGQRNAALLQFEDLAQLLQEQVGQEPEDETRRLYEQVRGGGETDHGPQPSRRPPAFPLLKTKLYIPVAPASRVVRSRLVKYLGQVDKKALTIISAPAGFGKTTLLAEWIGHTSLPVAWLSLDKGDNDPHRFLAYVIAALEGIQEGIGAESQQIMQSAQSVPAPVLLAPLINKLGNLPGACVLILDDYQFITEHPVHEILMYLLDHLPPSLHVLISTRADPPLQLGRLRAHGQMLELRAQDLRFTSQESSEFLNAVMQLGLSGEDIQALEARTEGWVVGLQMAALSLKGHQNATEFIRDFSGSHRYVLDYLVEEVLKRQSTHIQTFLLETSILEKFNSSLCGALMSLDWRQSGEGAQEVLEYLEKGNLFLVPLDDHKQWYRYHHLFADLLHSRLQQTSAGRAQELHAKASHWFEDQGSLNEAIDHAILSRDFHRGADLLDRSSQTRVLINVFAVQKWIEQIPEEILRGHPWIHVSQAWIWLSMGKLDGIERSLQLAEDCLQAGGNEKIRDKEAEDIRGHMAMVRAYLAFFRGQPRVTIQQATVALQSVRQSNNFLRSRICLQLGESHSVLGELSEGIRYLHKAIELSVEEGDYSVATVAYFRLGNVLKAQGKLIEAERVSRENLQGLKEMGGYDSPMLGKPEIALGDVLRERGQLEAARELLSAGHKHSQLQGQPYDLVYSYIYSARLYQAEGQAEQAADLLSQAEPLFIAYAIPPAVRLAFDACQVCLWLRLGKVSEVERWAAQNQLQGGTAVSYATEPILTALARLFWAQGKLGEANDLLDRLASATESAGRNGRFLEVLILRALVMHAAGDTSSALELLLKALNLAVPEGYLRIFLDEGLPMMQLLRELQDSLLDPALKDYVDRLLFAFALSA